MTAPLRRRDARGRFRTRTPLEVTVDLTADASRIACTGARRSTAHLALSIALLAVVWVLAMLAVLVVAAVQLTAATYRAVRDAQSRRRERLAHDAAAAEVADRIIAGTRRVALLRLEQDAPRWAAWSAAEGMPESAAVWRRIADQARAA